MRTGSESLYVYLQHPHTGQWVTAGRYRLERGAQMGWFTYAPDYLSGPDPVSIDPVNLPLTEQPREFPAVRYGGLHDVLRDACPDAWGQTLWRHYHGLSEQAHLSRFLLLADNADRWGALAAGVGRTPPIANLSHPRLAQLQSVVEELQAMSERRPALNPALRKRLTHRSSLGGARPKTTVVDADRNCWLVKPVLSTDTADIPQLEHFAMQWARFAGLNIAPTVLHGASESSATSAIRVLRFDREAHRRHMTLSAATLLQLEYPGTPGASPQRSYAYLAEVLRRLGAPSQDGTELFRRMVFNALCGNDDDHVRNHAVIYRPDERRWRLSPAYDLVPNPGFLPDTLALAVSLREQGLTRSALLSEHLRFGFTDARAAETCLDEFLSVSHARFEEAARLLSPAWQHEMHARLQQRMHQWQAAARK